MGLLDISAAVQHNLGRVLGFGAQLAEAERLERLAIEAFQRQGDPRLEGMARIYLAEILIAAGRLRRLRREEASAAVGALAVAPSLRVAALGALARARLGGGDLRRADWPPRARPTRRSSGWARLKRGSRSFA